MEETNDFLIKTINLPFCKLRHHTVYIKWHKLARSGKKFRNWQYFLYANFVSIRQIYFYFLVHVCLSSEKVIHKR